MALLGTLSSINLIAGAGILGNVGGVAITANSQLTSNVASYESLTVVQQFANIATSGYVSYAIVANTFPALTNSVPTAFQSALGNGPLTLVIDNQSGNILGNGDLGKFEQVFNSAQGLVNQTNQIIKSTVNATNSNVTTGFSGYDNLSTGGFSGITLAFAAFGEDLAQTGNLIDLENLANLGSPSTLLAQIATQANPTPALITALLNAGIPSSVADNLESANWTPELEKLAYQAMTTITGNDLKQILRLLKVTTPNINTLSDLLNPVKIFPRSYVALTAPTADGIRGIYLDSQGTVNSKLAETLPTNVLVPLQGNPLQINSNIL